MFGLYIYFIIFLQRFNKQKIEQMKKFLLALTFLLSTLILNAQNYDMTISTITMDDYAEVASAPFNLSAIVRNMGLQTINSFDLYMSVNGEDPAVYSYTGLNISQGTNYNILRLNAFDPPKPGEYSVKLWVSNLNNGNPDENNANDTLSKGIKAIDEIIQRNAFHEVFTSSTCPPCRPGNVVMHNVWNSTSQTPVYIKYQTDFPGSGDPYYTGEVGNMMSYYSVSSVPTAMVDGGWKGNSNGYSSGILDLYSGVPAYAEIESNYTVNGKTVNIQVAVKPLTDLNGVNRLKVGIFENTTFNNIKTNGESVFYNVFKKFVPNVNGTLLGNMNAGEVQTFEFSYTFQGNYRLPSNANSPINHSTEHSVEGFNDLNVAVWIQNDAGRKVQQSVYSLGKATNIDLELSSIAIPNMVEINNDVAISGIVKNDQSTVINSFDIVYTVDGGAEFRQNISGLNLQKGDTYSFSHNDLWSPSSLGYYRIEAFVDNVNGAGINTSDDLAVNDASFKYVEAVSQISSLPVEKLAGLVKVYPNPSNGFVTINSMIENIESVEVYSLLGDKISTIVMGSKGNFELNMSNYSSGMYVLKFNSSNGTFSKTLIIQ